MSLITLLLIAVGLAIDAFAVALAVSATLRTVSPRHVFRLAFHFGLFQAVMPILGWAGGRTIGRFVADWDHWVAFGLLAAVGGKAIYEALRRPAWHTPRTDPTRGLSLVTLSVATSIDAFAVGITLAMLQVSIWYPAAVIGCVAAALTCVGLRLGARLGAAFGRWMEIGGGLILIGIGVKIVMEHVLAEAG